MPDHVWGQGLWDQARWDTRTADHGSLALTGGAAALRLGRRLPAVAGTLTLSGRTAALVYTPAAGINHYTLTGERGVITLIGKHAILDVTRVVPPVDPLPQIWHMGRRQRYLLGPWVSR